MMIKKVTLSIALTIVFGLTIFFTYVQASENASTFPNQDDSLKRIAKEATVVADGLGLENDIEKKWVKRAVMQAKIDNRTIANKDILDEAINAMKKRQAWFDTAKEIYGVTVTEAELNSYIDSQYEEFKDLPVITQVTDGLGISKKEFFYNFESDNFKKNLIWNKLKPYLMDKYPIYESEKQNLLEYNNRLVTMFNIEVDNFLNK